MKNIYIILFPLTLIIPTAFIFLTNKNYQKEVIAKCSHIYGLETNTLRIKFELLKKNNKIAEYPLIEKEILDLLSLEKNRYIDIKKLKMRRYKVFNISPIIKLVDLMDEMKRCEDKDVIDLLIESSKLINKISAVRFPYKIKVNKFFHKVQEIMLRYFILMFESYKNISKKDIEEAEKEDCQIKSNLSYY